MVSVASHPTVPPRQQSGPSQRRLGAMFGGGLTLLLVVACSTESPQLIERPCAPLIAYNQITPPTNQPIRIERVANAPAQKFQVPRDAVEECEEFQLQWTLDDMDRASESLGTGENFELHPCDELLTAADPYTTVLHATVQGTAPDDGMTRLSWTVIVTGSIENCQP